MRRSPSTGVMPPSSSSSGGGGLGGLNGGGVGTSSRLLSAQLALRRWGTRVMQSPLVAIERAAAWMASPSASGGSGGLMRRSASTSSVLPLYEPVPTSAGGSDDSQGKRSRVGRASSTHVLLCDLLMCILATVLLFWLVGALWSSIDRALDPSSTDEVDVLVGPDGDGAGAGGVAAAADTPYLNLEVDPQADAGPYGQADDEEHHHLGADQPASRLVAAVMSVIHPPGSAAALAFRQQQQQLLAIQAMARQGQQAQDGQAPPPMFNERLARENLALQAAREARRDAEDRAAQQAKQDAAAEANEAFSAVLSRPPLGTRVPAADAATLLARESRASRRRDAVREAFLHAWDGYSLYAWGHDEVRPVSNATNDSWGSWGATLVDGLDTAMLMGVGPEVLERARQHVANIQWNKRPEYYASFFEVTIRYLGGLLGAYELSREQTYLIKARELADALLPSFDSPSGLPRSQINPATGHAKNAAWAGGGQSILAEVASCQLELEYLSFHTGDPKYAGVARKVIEVLDEAEAESEVPGLLPTYIDPTSGKFSNSHYSLGSFGDSAYEYLLKSWLLTDRRDQRSLRLFNRAMAAMEERMVKSFWASFIEDDDKPFHEEEALESASAVATTTSSGQAAGRRVTKRFAFIGELTGASSYKHVMEHLTCFVPGMLALAVASGADEGFKNERGWPQEANRIMAHQHERTDTPGRRVGAAGSSSDGEDAAAVSVASSAVATSDAAAAAGQLTAEELELRSSAARHTSVADALLNTCMAAYKLTATGLAPESWSFEPRDMPTEANRRAKVRAIQRTKREEYTRRGALPPSGLAAVQAGLEEDPANSNPNAAGEAIARLMERKMRRAGVHAGPDGLPMLRKPGQIVPVGVAGSGDDDDNNGRRGGKSSSAVLALSSLSDIDPDLDPSDPDTDGYGLRVVRVEHEADLLVSGSGFGADSGGGGGLFRIDQRKYVLRPETVESLFIAFRLTGEERFRDAAWDIFVNLQKNCRTPTAFSGIKDCDYGRGAATATDDADAKSAWSPRVHQRARVQGADGPANWRDSQESFFFAETLKYLYLIFSPTDVLPLDRFVFNTEAHPLGILVEHDRPAINTAAAAAAQQPAANELR